MNDLKAYCWICKYEFEGEMDVGLTCPICNVGITDWVEPDDE